MTSPIIPSKLSNNCDFVNELSRTLTANFGGESITKMARESKFECRKPKLQGIDFVTRILEQNPDHPFEFSLSELRDSLRLRSNVKISSQGVDKRFNESSVEFSKALLSRSLNLKFMAACGIDLASQFEQIRVEDWSGKDLPSFYQERYPGSGGSGSGAALKFYLDYDLKCKGDLDLKVAPFNTNLSGFLRKANKGELILGDLQYSTLYHMKDIIACKAYFLYRLNHSLNVYMNKPNGELKQIDLVKTISKIPQGETWEFNVFLGKNDQIPVRLCIEKAPEAVAAERRRKLKNGRKKGNPPTKRTLDLCAGTFMVSNTSPEQLPKKALRAAYSLRWQIEIMFKIWKSVFNLDKIKSMKIERFETILFINLMKIIIFMKIAKLIKANIWNQLGKEISEWKLLQMLNHETLILFNLMIAKRVDQLTSALRECNNIAQYLKKDKVKGTKRPFEIISDIS